MWAATIWAFVLLEWPLRLQQTVFTVVENATSELPSTHRHVAEKDSLLQRLSRTQGHWNEHHPRYRLLEALRGFSSYAETNLAELDHLKGLYRHVSKRQKALLERTVSYSSKFTSISDLIAKNQDICDAIVQNALDFYHVDRAELDRHKKEMIAARRPAEKVSVSQALKHLVRDWGDEGASERDAAFPCIIKALGSILVRAQSHGSHHDDFHQPLQVLLPGAGLGRLGHHISQSLGHAFQVTNNEWSMYQNVVYRFLENTSPTSQQQQQPPSTVYPFIDSWSHHSTTSNMLRGVSFPNTPLHVGGVVLVEGDFTTAFSSEQQMGYYDVVVTHFFIDTARNLMSYLDTIFRVLKPGGHWVNFGPLLYGSAPFVQLSLEEVLAVSEAMGFRFDHVPDGCCGVETLPGRKACGVEAAYGFDARALTKNAYDAQLWVARRD
ncbi:N2227-like protein-domain-containing protein [Cercophora newfieldiana]|uniref:N2227-like protein-domain-containing protein n=1 Tax=Cercophora newfieldiana TaxID=92897 RepID=A0AA39YSN7_9PEZI|nr:N2227-like protein-domain-containing protein [Cercophora newfieldiana]